jgi:periplasmic protein TonB
MSVPSPLTRSLPVSILFHVALLVLVIVIPLTGEIALPSPAMALPRYMRAEAIPAPPAAPRAGGRVAPPATATRSPRSSIPTVAPLEIGPERVVPGVVDVPDVGAVPGSGDLRSIIGSAPTTPIAAPPPPAQKPRGPVRVTELIESPRKIVDARPLYPDIARAARVEGTVVLEAVIDPSGHVQQLRLLKPIPLLDAAAMDAVRQWQYTPSRLRGEPVSVLMTVTVTFQLH